jgi:hypothetical protein
MPVTKHLVMAAWLIVLGGTVVVMLPLVIAGAHPAQYLRGNANGRKSTTTMYPRPSLVPEHTYHNEAVAVAADSSDQQIRVPIPESGGRPTGRP